MVRLIDSTDVSGWRNQLHFFERIDVCHMPEYHDAYTSRFPGAKAIMFVFEESEQRFAYPFLLAPVLIEGSDTGFYDVSGVYGFSGPLSTSSDDSFLNKAWSCFDQWAQENFVISEFVRFSVYARNHIYAHPRSEVLPNRPISVATFGESELLASLPSKTRNMIRRALKEGFIAKEVNFAEGLKSFRDLYTSTMSRNKATDFFDYDDDYYQRLQQLPTSELALYLVYKDECVVSGAMALLHQEYGFYHLGASNSEWSKFGAGNLALYSMMLGAMDRGVRYFNVGGGRTTAYDDPLFVFKRNNGTSSEQFYIGKRIINPLAYREVAERWKQVTGDENIPSQLQFYR